VVSVLRIAELEAKVTADTAEFDAAMERVAETVRRFAVTDQGPQPNISNARCVRQVDGPSGTVVMAWRMNEDGVGIVDVVKPLGDRQHARVRMTEEEATAASDEDVTGWVLLDLLRARADAVPDFVLTAWDASAVVHGLRATVEPMKRDATARAEARAKEAEERSRRESE